MRGRLRASVGIVALAVLAGMAVALPAHAGPRPLPGVVLEPGEALPKLTGERARTYARRTIVSDFDFFRFSDGKRVRCGERLSRTARRCAVRWSFGDVSYRGRVTVRYLECGAGVCWRGRYRLEALDEYCRFEQDRPRDRCTTTFKGTS